MRALAKAAPDGAGLAARLFLATGDRPGAATARPVLLLSAAHPPGDTRVVRKEGAALAAAGWPVVHLCPDGAASPARIDGVEILRHRHRRLRGQKLYSGIRQVEPIS